jgi:hypothetical protein
MAEPLSTLISQSLRTLLRETIIRADVPEGYVLNPGDPGLVDTLKSVSAKVASTPPGPGRKPIASHANHVLYGFGLVCRAIDGDRKAFEGADWDEAWKLERVNDAEWAELLGRLEAKAQHIVDAGPKIETWVPQMLSGMFGTAAHTAYHLGAIRQMLLDVQAAR